ncbi:MAG: hypothetical protein [Circoviridae sp.]|nr:MAG: hypothetical protein [Circoviridae sp.]
MVGLCASWPEQHHLYEAQRSFDRSRTSHDDRRAPVINLSRLWINWPFMPTQVRWCAQRVHPDAAPINHLYLYRWFMGAVLLKK